MQGLGFEQPLAETLQVTLAIFGTEYSRPDRQVGLRWELVDELRLSIAARSGNGRNIANSGVTGKFRIGEQEKGQPTTDPLPWTLPFRATQTSTINAHRTFVTKGRADSMMQLVRYMYLSIHEK